MNEDELKAKLRAVKAASYALQEVPEEKLAQVMDDFAARLRAQSPALIAANRRDLEKMDPASPLYDRLLLDAPRLAAIADDVEKIARLPTPVGQVIEQRVLPNGINLARVRVPLGVVGIIYESRPNVTMDVFALCWRTRNACVLRGGSDAYETNSGTVSLIRETLAAHGLSRDLVFLLPPDRHLTPIMLAARGAIDVVIPRGSQALIDHVRETATIPVIETGAGVVHIYFDAAGDAALAAPIIDNAKTRRPSVCNAVDTLLVHESRLADLPTLAGGLAQKNVILHADEKCWPLLAAFYPAALLKKITASAFGTEYLSLQMNVAAVASLDAALAHVRAHGSGHTEAIITQDERAAEKYLVAVDAAVVMVNASTGFCDGGQFGLGAEVGISTQKLHARGPMGLEALTSYKWLLRGRGQIRKISQVLRLF